MKYYVKNKRKVLKEESQSLSQVCNVVFQHTINSHTPHCKPHSQKMAAPFFDFGLSHAPNQPQGIDRKNTTIGKYSLNGSHNAQQAVWRNGGCGSFNNTLIIDELHCSWQV